MISQLLPPHSLLAQPTQHPVPALKGAAIHLAATIARSLDPVDRTAHLLPLLRPVLQRQPLDMGDEAHLVACMMDPPQQGPTSTKEEGPPGPAPAVSLSTTAAAGVGGGGVGGGPSGEEPSDGSRPGEYPTHPAAPTTPPPQLPATVPVYGASVDVSVVERGGSRLLAALTAAQSAQEVCCGWVGAMGDG